jgi:hypothetical protein
MPKILPTPGVRPEVEAPPSYEIKGVTYQKTESFMIIVVTISDLKLLHYSEVHSRHFLRRALARVPPASGEWKPVWNE